MNNLSFRKMLRVGIIAILLSGCGPAKDKQAGRQPLQNSQDGFIIKRGVNISHWLSQSGRRGTERAAFFVKEDMAFIASIGYDHVRIPIDEEQMWSESGTKEPEAFDLLHKGIALARDLGLRVIIDLHILRSHHFNYGEQPLWTDPAAQERFYQCWRDLSDELIEYKDNLVAYELMNEPVADDPEDWNLLVEACVNVIREKEPHRTIVVGSNRWQSVQTFKDLRIPENDPNIILSFHFYTPFLITHYKASWTGIAGYKGPVHYPGLSVEEADMKGLPEELIRSINSYNRVYNRDTLEALMQLPILKARELGLQLYCGEWGCYKSVPNDILLKFYSDVRFCLEKNDVAWANWDYKGGFGIVDGERIPHDDLINVLLKEDIE